MEEFTEAGYWWYPNKPDCKYPGTLSNTSEGGIRLSISSIIDPRSFSVSSPADMLHGTTKSGEKYTLLRGFETSTGTQSSDLNAFNKPPYIVGHKDLFFNFALKGVHSTNEYDDIRVKSISLVPEFMNRWFFDSSITFERTERFEEIKLSYNPDNKYEYELDNGLNLQLHRRLDNYPFSASWDGDLEFNEKTYITLSFKEPKTLDEVCDYYSSFEDLYTILFSRRSRCLTISLELEQMNVIDRNGEKEEMPCFSEWLIKPRHLAKVDAPHPGDILFRFEDIKEKFGEISNNWLRQSKKLKQIRQIYISALYSSEKYLEPTVLELSKALEVYHRRFYEGSLLDKDEFRSNVLSVLVEAIPERIERSIKETFKARLQYINEFSLNKRLKQLNEIHSMPLSIFDINSKKIIRYIVNARNHFTHYTLVDVEKSITFDSLCACQDYLKLLCDICFLHEMGFSEEDIAKNIGGSQTYRRTSLKLMR